MCWLFCLSDSFKDMGNFCDFNLVLMGGGGGLNVSITDRLKQIAHSRGKTFSKGCDKKKMGGGRGVLVVTKMIDNNNTLFDPLNFFQPLRFLYEIPIIILFKPTKLSVALLLLCVCQVVKWSTGKRGKYCLIYNT